MLFQFDPFRKHSKKSNVAPGFYALSSKVQYWTSWMMAESLVQEPSRLHIILSVLLVLIFANFHP